MSCRKDAKAPKAAPHKINDRFGLHPRQNASCFEGRQEKLSAPERNKNGLSHCFYDCFHGLLPRPKGLKKQTSPSIKLPNPLHSKEKEKMIIFTIFTFVFLVTVPSAIFSSV
jgi:hypothetical protein